MGWYQRRGHGSYNLACEMGTSLTTLPKVPEFNERSRQLQFADDQYHNSGGAPVTPSFSDFSFYPDKYNLPRSQQKGFVDQKPSEDVGVVFTGQKLPTYQSTPSGFDVAFTQEQDATKVSVTPNNPDSSLELTTPVKNTLREAGVSEDQIKNPSRIDVYFSRKTRKTQPLNNCDRKCKTYTYTHLDFSAFPDKGYVKKGSSSCNGNGDEDDEILLFLLIFVLLVNVLIC